MEKLVWLGIVAIVFATCLKTFLYYMLTSKDTLYSDYRNKTDLSSRHFAYTLAIKKSLWGGGSALSLALLIWLALSI